MPKKPQINIYLGYPDYDEFVRDAEDTFHRGAVTQFAYELLIWAWKAYKHAGSLHALKKLKVDGDSLTPVERKRQVERAIYERDQRRPARKRRKIAGDEAS